ncbi:MAG TPA: hypothetical protein VHC69_21790 [Polyangiaceae bacterium]|nr:hypothetical protein [Polyangiaceae bacterium]
MTTNDGANRPRFRGQPGFFEIWFLVLFEPSNGRAYWLRYTTFSPALSAGGDFRATVWAAAFDAHGTAPAKFVKAVYPESAYQALPAGIRIGNSELGNGHCRGEVRGDHTFAWELTFSTASPPRHRGPWFMHHRMPLPTRVIHVHDSVQFRGHIIVDGERRAVEGAPGLQKHIWGTRRVEELLWLYCAAFREDPDARVEATAVRARRELSAGVEMPWLTPIALRTAGDDLGFHGTLHTLRNDVVVERPCALTFRGGGLLRKLELRAACDPRTLAGYVYRDPSGWDAYVAQSDVASCEADLFSRAHPFARWAKERSLTAEHAAALEFHSRTPIAGVRYVPWDIQEPKGKSR